MAPKVRITKKEILSRAVDIVREKGDGALNSRLLAKELNCSTQPVFSNYASMEELRHDVIVYANDLYQDYCKKTEASGKYINYKAKGMAYIIFAREERELFKLLYMRDRSEESIAENEADGDAAPLCGYLGLGIEEARLFHLEMWIFVHGIAVMLATGFLSYDDEFISSMLTDNFEGLKHRFGVKK